MDIVDRLSTDLKQHYAESSDRFNHLETRYEESIQLSQSALESHAKNHQALHEKHQDGMETIRKTFREEIALREPNKYWQGKCSRHQMYATIWGIATAILLAIAMLGLAHFAPDYFSKMDSLPSIESGKPYPAVVAHDTWRIGVFALMAIFGFWAVRLVVRMFLSHLHLHADASERMVMLQTYLALMEGNKLEDKDDRKLILQALFRPSTDGLVKDESAPPSIGEWLTRSGK
ncbi:hypothetical protein SAMN04489710_10890 [Paracidovorax konjaci]|uniref:DUF6161 domain-containing protein n=2 Tax=Paracidovorax konjaci TaxID=32040 RepID=A0A1I1W3J0_9BURK|nr:hypothetical protein SAMN04489710_10890 [Paracidovorax konjaci]